MLGMIHPLTSFKQKLLKPTNCLVMDIGVVIRCSIVSTIGRVYAMVTLIAIALGE